MADPLAHFLSIPWAAKLLTDPAVLDIWVSDRRPLASGEKQFVRSVLSSEATVRACVTFSLRVPASAEGKRAVSKSAALLRGGGPEDGEDPERRPFLLFSALLDMGEGLCGFKGTLHGGALAVLLDETMCSAADNQSRECFFFFFCHTLERARETLADEVGGVEYVVRATMTTRFLKPVKVPGAVMVRARVVRKTGRKIWVRGTIEDGDGEFGGC
jgi:acyl-coenzyme A thioesterase PaaI-like protein